jgi:hypothetical protein
MKASKVVQKVMLLEAVPLHPVTRLEVQLTSLAIAFTRSDPEHSLLKVGHLI